jgi:hypothetical protein
VSAILEQLDLGNPFELVAVFAVEHGSRRGVSPDPEKTEPEKQRHMAAATGSSTETLAATTAAKRDHW